jgi:hypothetical protein
LKKIGKPIITKVSKRRTDKSKRTQKVNPRVKFDSDPFLLTAGEKDEIRFVPMDKVAARVLGRPDTEDN